MESVLKMIQRTNFASEQADTARSRILDEIREVSRLLAYNDCWFQYECDDNLIDACIFQREELSARYRYLLEKAKQLGVSCDP
jgi:hypothetical protein